MIKAILIFFGMFPLAILAGYAVIQGLKMVGVN